MRVRVGIAIASSIVGAFFTESANAQTCTAEQTLTGQ
jgi:hypothetical protein